RGDPYDRRDFRQVRPPADGHAEVTIRDDGNDLPLVVHDGKAPAMALPHPLGCNAKRIGFVAGRDVAPHEIAYQHGCLSRALSNLRATFVIWLGVAAQ